MKKEEFKSSHDIWLVDSTHGICLVDGPFVDVETLARLSVLEDVELSGRLDDIRLRRRTGKEVLDEVALRRGNPNALGHSKPRESDGSRSDRVVKAASANDDDR